MAYLEKIKICGIRSFGPNEDDMQTIRFQKPLTLILGENGCGKSTIIECLRYLTAQKEPAGKGAFVHDPNLTGKSIVKGFVKLQITDMRGNRIDLCRQLQATRTKKTLTTKSLDNVITRTNKETKEKQSISNRCADFTYEISRIFGVSRAILENVIFCTQEDSHWPLETDQKLKEKFDQIFDSDKYNKCVAKVRDKMKKLRDNCKMSTVELKHLENNKLMAAEKRREIEKTKKQIKNCEEEVNTLNSSLTPIDLKLKDINQREMQMSKNHTLKETKKAELREVEKYLSDLKKRIGTEFQGSDRELLDALSNFSQQLLVRQKELAKLEEDVVERARRESKLSKELMYEQGKLGQLLKEEEINKERLNERNRILNALAVELDVDSNELTQGSEDSFQCLYGNIQKKIKTEEEKLKTLKVRYNKEERDHQNLIDKLKETQLATQSEVSNMERNIRERETEMSKIKRELNEIEQSASRLSKLEDQLSKTNDELDKLQSLINLEELKREIQKTLNDRDQTEDRLSEVEETVKVLQQNTSISAELDLQKDLQENKNSDIHRLINKHEDTLKGILGDFPESGFKSTVQSHIDKLKRQVKELTAKQSRKEKELTELEMKRKHQKEQLRLNEEKLRVFEEEIYEECGSDDLDETVKSLQNEIDELQDVKGTLSSSEFMYQRYIRVLQKPKPCCPLCHRDFNRQDEAQVLVEELTSKVQEVPNKLNENKNLLEEKQKKFNSLLMMRSKHDQSISLKNLTLPNLRSEMDGIEAPIKRIRKELEEIGNQLLPAQTDEAVLVSIQGDMALLDQLQMEKKKIGWEIERLESRLGSAGTNKGNLSEMFKEQETLRLELKTKRQKLEELQTKLNKHNEDLQVRQAKKNSLMEEMNKIQGGAGRKKELSDRYADLQGMNINQSEELDGLKEKFEDVNRELKDALSKKNIENSRHADEIEKFTQSLMKHQRQFQDLQTANNHVKMYESKGVAKKLESCQSLMKKLESEIKQIKLEKDRSSNSVNEIKRELSNQESRERELEDNVKYREKTKYCEDLGKEVKVLELKCGDMNFDSILREKRKLKDEEEAIGRKKALIQGRLGELELRIELLEKELQSKMFKNIETDYQKELLNIVLMTTCAKDLERYAATMEYAMMTYHKQQMSRVNGFIREYWRKIYQGNDIDYIEIQTDTIESSERRRNYNYKLVQMKGDVCLDMRNRCSAGQKMLASLIIRMALAETFSCNCGILTLDEPTTNLDRKNIRNLARTLNEILLAKESLLNANFQLIVITHDEEFLRELMEIDAVNEYVRVYRNNRGKTRVTREVMDGSVPRIGQFSRGMEPEDSEEYDYD